MNEMREETNSRPAHHEGFYSQHGGARLTLLDYNEEKNTATINLDDLKKYISLLSSKPGLGEVVERVKSMKKTVLDFPPLENGTGDMLSANAWNAALAAVLSLLEELAQREG